MARSFDRQSQDIGLLARGALVTGVVVALTGCSSPSEPEVCASVALRLYDNVCLAFESAEPFQSHQALIESEVRGALQIIGSHLAVSDLRISFVGDSAGVIPEVRIGGFNPDPTEVRIFLYPDETDVSGVLSEQLAKMLAHEYHHAVRRRSVGYGSSLFEAAVSEGLADHFALQVRGGDPAPWSVALTPFELETWRDQVIDSPGAGYDHDNWFFGASASIPRWTGYAVGFHLVSEYLLAHPGATAASLVGEPANAFR